MSHKIYKKQYAKLVYDLSLIRGKVSNRNIAVKLGVDEKTIRNWRSENADFDAAFSDAIENLKAKINKAAESNLKMRKRKVITTSPDGLKTTVEDVLPTYNDIALFSKTLGMGSTVRGKDEERKDECGDILRKIMKRKVDQEITAIEAAQLLESEGITPPETLMVEVRQVFSSDSRSKGGDVYRTMTDEEIAAAVQHARAQSDEPEGW